jgi:two-component system chemotaxis response regulator CheB
MPSTTDPFAVIVIGASAGGIEPLLQIVRSLPVDLPAALCVVVHFPDTASSLLPRLLARRSKLPASHARAGQRLEAGCVYVAPPGEHLLLDDGRMALTRGPRENGHRPAIDPLFRTAARQFGPRCIAVILSGTLDDGAQGARLVKAHGGRLVVQDPDDAMFDAMPRNAIAAASPDVVVPASDIGAVLSRLASEIAMLPPEAIDAQREAAMNEPDPDDPADTDAALVATDKAELEQNGRHGETTMFTCPDCGGVLWELNDGAVLRYRCHVGHAYTAEGLRAEQAQKLEGALWTAVRALEESASLARRLAHRARTGKRPRSADQFEARADEDEQRADLVRQALAFSAAPVASEVNALDSGGGTGG